MVDSTLITIAAGLLAYFAWVAWMLAHINRRLAAIQLALKQMPPIGTLGATLLAFQPRKPAA